LLEFRHEWTVGPFGSEAVVINGTFASTASFAKIVAFVRSSGILMSLTVWNSRIDDRAGESRNPPGS
jgi:hypothetical protein